MKARRPGADLVRRAGFPWTAPPWPTSVPKPPAERTTGVAFETDWARRYPARLARAVWQDNVTRPVIRLVADPTVSLAISSASRSESARRYPRRATYFGSPPTKITSPQWSRPCAPQYHM